MKRRISVIFLVILMITSVFTACDNGINNKEQVSKVIFTDSESLGRGLNSSSAEFDPDVLYWTYEARKTDGSGLHTGATSKQEAVSSKTPVEPGLASSVGPFSLGEWQFKLYAYLDAEFQNLAYSGTVNNVIIRNVETNTVKVKVNALQDGVGKIEVARSFALTDTNGNPVNNADEVITLTSVADSQDVRTFKNSEIRVFEVPSGAWKVTVSYVSPSKPDIAYGRNSIYVNVFDNQTVKVGGTLEEITADTKFETTVNGGVKATFTPTNPVVKADGVKLTIESSPSAAQSAEKTTVIDIPADALKTEGAAEISITSYDSVTASQKITVADGVSGTAIAGLDIDLKIADQQVTEFNDMVTVSTYITKNLPEKPVVVYNGGGSDMQPDQSLVTYEPSTGLLTFKTNHFSQYYVVSDVVALNETTGEYFRTVQDFNENMKNVNGLACAFFGALDNQKIILLDDVSFGNGPFDYLQVAKKIEFDMNGHTINAEAGPYALVIVFSSGELTIGNGEITLRNSNKNLFQINGGRLIIDGGTYTLLSQKEPEQPNCMIGVFNKGYLKINDGVFNAESVDYCVSTNGNPEHSPKIDINGGTFNGTCFFSSSGNLNIRNAAFKNDSTCLSIKSGNISVDNCSFVTTGNAGISGTWAHLPEGANRLGSAVVIEACGYPGGNPVVSFDNCTFDAFSDKDYGLLVIDWRKTAETALNSVDRTGLNVPYGYVSFVGPDTFALDETTVENINKGESCMFVSSAVATSGNGSEEAPLKTINEALVNPNTDVIYVAEGTYAEDVTIPAGRKVILRGTGSAVTNGAANGSDLDIASDTTHATIMEGTLTVDKNADVIVDNMIIQRQDASSHLIRSTAGTFNLTLKNSVLLPARNGRQNLVEVNGPTAADVINYTLDGTFVRMSGNMGYKGNNGFRFDGDKARTAEVSDRPTLNFSIINSRVYSEEVSNTYPISLSRVGVVNINISNSEILSRGNHYSIWYWDCGQDGKESVMNIDSSKVQGWSPLYFSYSRNVKVNVTNSNLIGKNINSGGRDGFSTINIEGCSNLEANFKDSRIEFLQEGTAPQSLISFAYQSDTASYPEGCAADFVHCDIEWERNLTSDESRALCYILNGEGLIPNQLSCDEYTMNSILGTDYDLDLSTGHIVLKVK